MSKPKLFEYAVIHHPREKGSRSKIVVSPEIVLAATDQEAVILASRAIPVEHLDHLEEVEIVVRPF